MTTRFKETKIGRIPEEWEVVKIKEVCRKKTNKFEPRESKITYPYVGLEHIEAHLHKLNGYGQSDETLSTKNMFATNDILYGKLRPYLNKVWKAEFNGVCTTEIIVILADDNIEQDYLYYSLQQKRFVEYVNSMTEGTSLPRANWDDIQKYQIALPPKEEQFRIIEILSAIDETIEKTDAIIQETQQLEKGLMQKLFTEGIGHSRFKETKIGRIPQDWDCDTIGNVGKVRGGKRLPKGDQFAKTKTSYPYVRVVDFKDMSVATNGLKYLTEKSQKSIARYTISSSDVYISIAGTIGLVGIIPDELDGANLTENAAKIGSLKKVNKVFLAYYLSSLNAQKQIASFVGTSTQPKLALNRIEKIQLPIPELDEQRKIAGILSEVDSKIQKEQAYKEELEQLKKGLMQALLTGKVRVKV